MNYEIRQHGDPSSPDLGDLVDLAEAEGHEFVARTKSQWASGANRFDQKGEAFFVAYGDSSVVGICGLNSDPYLNDSAVGRLRHLYVHPSHRRAGMAEALVTRCLGFAVGRFDRVRLRTSNPAADALYRSMGFTPVLDSSATHEWRTSSQSGS